LYAPLAGEASGACAARVACAVIAADLVAVPRIGSVDPGPHAEVNIDAMSV
jgi:hypothetical protein